MKLSDDDTKAFLDVAEPIYQAVLNNSIENLRLSELRDSKEGSAHQVLQPIFSFNYYNKKRHPVSSINLPDVFMRENQERSEHNGKPES